MTDRRIGTLVGQYLVEDLLGMGGMAAVYKAVDTRTNRSVAIKLMHSHLAHQKSFQDAFMQEAAAIARLSHPNIVRILAFEQQGDDLVLVMELISGGNLRLYLKQLAEKSEVIPLTHAVDIIIQLCNAINYAHQQNMMHRDLKPDNVVLQPFTSAKDLFPFRPIITDFGLARLSTSDENAITDQPLGTYAYMSPEQCLAERIDPRTDIYSLGIMLYELTVGQLPYKPQTIAEAARFHGREPLPLPSRIAADFPPRLEEVIVKALQKKPEDRYETAGDMAKALLSLRGALVKGSKSIIDGHTEMRPAGETASDSSEGVDPPAPKSPAKRPEVPSIDAIFNRTEIKPMPRSLAPEEDPFDGKTQPRLFTGNPLPPLSQLSGARTVLGDDDPTVPEPPPVPPAPAQNTTPSDQPSTPAARPAGEDPIDGRTQPKLFTTNPLPPLSKVSTARTVLGDEESPPPTPPAPQGAGPKFSPGEAGLSLFDITPPPGTTDDSLDFPLATEWNPPTPTPSPAPVPAPSVPVVKPAPSGTSAVDQMITEKMKQPLPAQVPRMLKLGKNVPPSTSGDYLVCMNVLRHTFVFPLDKEETTIGTGSDQEVQLEAQYMSRRHARVSRTDSGLYVTDVGSSNGTWVGNDPLPKRQPRLWQYGEVVRMGDFWMTVLRGDTAPAKPQFVPSEQRRDRRPVTTVTVRKTSTGEVPVAVNAPKPSGVSSSNPGAVPVAPPSPVPKAAAPLATAPQTAVAPPAPPPRPPAAQTAPAGRLDDALDRTILKMDELPPEQDDKAALPTDKGLEGKIIHNYRLDRFLGQGGIASVYAATDLRLNKPVAVKILHESLAAQEPFRKKFIDEARIASNLEHPNVVRVLYYDQSDEHVYLVMELVAGGSLRQYIRRLRKEDRVLPYNQIISMGRQIAEGLHYAHQQGLVHRDIKPDNIVLRDTSGDNLHPVLTDFGLANVSAGAVGETFITDQPTVMYPYMSPEAVMGAKVDTRSDVYEVGTILYELTVGQVPYQPRSLAEAIRMHTREPLVRPSELRLDVPRELERVIVRCLEKDPNNRYQTAIELARTLETIGKNLDRQEQVDAAPIADDPHRTQVMAAPIDVQMPYFTPQPVTDEQVGYDRLIIYSEKYPSRSLRIERDIITIGRDADNTLQLESTNVSRRHARIERFGSAYRLIDLSSRNGTWLGTARLLPNVAEVWESVKAARIGDYWIRIEPSVQQVRAASRSPLALTNLDDGEVPEILPGSAAQLAAPAVVLPPPQHDRIGLTVLTPILSVQPGQSVSLAIEIHNLSNLVDHFVIQVHGLPHEWVTIHSEPIYLLPNNRETASVTLHPPLRSTSSAGAHAFEISVTARAQRIKSVSQQCALNVLPFYNFRADLMPQRVRSGGRTELEITNTGNTYDTYTVQARDREQAIRFTADGKQFTVPPGQTEYVSLRLSPRRRPLLGSASYLPFEISTYSQQPGIVPQTQTGELVVRPYLPGWLVGLLLFVCIGCGLLSALLYTQYTNIILANQTATAVYVATSLPVTATAYGLLDDDNDRLINAKEIELGTDPLLPDTDKDGLTDGEEVLVWLTDPLNPDTDGDGLSDGDEVLKFGTNPRNPDTDGDGIPDNIDVAPQLTSTFTPTPFPTLFGTNGEICPNTPPTRLAVGRQGRVEFGGVENRLRDNPGKSVGQIIALLPPGTEFTIIGGPTCDPVDFIRWWQIDVKGQQGWTAEGEGEEYYLAPKDAPPPGSEGAGGSASPDVVASTDQVLAALPGTDTSALNRGQMGVQLAEAVNTERWSAALNVVDSTKIAWIKVQLNWAEVQPDSAADFGPAFQNFIANLRTAKERGYKVLVSIASAPRWSRAIAYNSPGPPDDPQTLALFLTFLLQQAGGLIDGIEIWNEPNLRREWTGALPFTGAGYMSLFEAAYRVIRAFSSDIIIVSAGLAPTADTPQSVDDRRFLRQMLAAGLAGYGDVVIGVHPYSWANAPDVRCCVVIDGRGWNNDKRFYFLDNLELTRTIMNEFGASQRLWITEFGYATWDGISGPPPEAWYGYLTPDEQAGYLLRAIQVAQSLGYIDNFFVWNLNFASDSDLAARNPHAAFSLILRDSTPRPALQRLQQS
jgi:serine/threonine protein kinase